jgi:hypothetical protein
MARDIFTEFHRCRYCDRAGIIVWDVDVYSCGHEMCKTLAFAEVRRRHAHGGGPVKRRRWVSLPAAHRHSRLGGMTETAGSRLLRLPRQLRRNASTQAATSPRSRQQPWLRDPSVSARISRPRNSWSERRLLGRTGGGRGHAVRAHVRRRPRAQRRARRRQPRLVEPVSGRGRSGRARCPARASGGSSPRTTAR